MKVKEIEVNYGVTRNMGNYESLRLDYTVRVVPQEGESTERTFAACRKQLRLDVNQAIEEEIEFLHGSAKPVRRG